MLKQDAIAIWKAAVSAVDSSVLVQKHVIGNEHELVVCGHSFSPARLRHIEVVGAGKAGAGMARGIACALSKLPETVSVGGWINVPDDCVEPLADRKGKDIQLHGARPAGVNEPTQAGVEGTAEILRRVAQLGSHDLCLVLISGGGSALLPCPAPPVKLDEKLQVTRLLASAGADITELNVVRTHLSRVKGGGLLRHCNAESMMTLVISDVIGDPLEIIASGPTVPSTSTASDALRILRKYDPDQRLIPSSVYSLLDRPSQSDGTVSRHRPISNHIIGSNAVALKAAEETARLLGYHVINLGSEHTGEASRHGATLMKQLISIRSSDPSDRQLPVCVLAGGETTVRLTTAKEPGKGGRNQEVVLGAMAAFPDKQDWQGLVLLSGGTDGEDGPTDAAGAVADAAAISEMNHQSIRPQAYLDTNNSYEFFRKLNALVRTGPTHTNVLDIAVGLADRIVC